jgi:hypothetical protein
MLTPRSAQISNPTDMTTPSAAETFRRVGVSESAVDKRQGHQVEQLL